MNKHVKVFNEILKELQITTIDPIQEHDDVLMNTGLLILIACLKELTNLGLLPCDNKNKEEEIIKKNMGIRLKRSQQNAFKKIDKLDVN